MFTKSKPKGVTIIIPEPKSQFQLQNDEEIDLKLDLFPHIRFLLVLGRFLGIIPYMGAFKRPSSFKNLQFRIKSPVAIASFTVLFILTINLFLGILFTIKMRPNKSAYEISKSVGQSVQFIWAWMIYLNFIYRREKFLALFNYWQKTTIYFQAPDFHLKRDCILITLCIMTSAILENGVLHLEFTSAFDYISGSKFIEGTSNNMSILETYYRRSHYHWAHYLGYNQVLAIIAFIQHKWTIYSWNYMDIFIAVFSRAMYFKFKMLNKLSKDLLVKPMKNGKTENNDIPTTDWIQIAHDHKKLCHLLDKIKNYFSPLIFGSYAVNIFYICIQLLDGLTSDMTASSLVHSIYAPWSTLHIIMRMYILSINAARINSYAHKVQEVIHECPTEQYLDQISRLDKKVTSGPSLGLSGLDCFVVTKPFMLHILSVIFTFELVLLQGAP